MNNSHPRKIIPKKKQQSNRRRRQRSLSPDDSTSTIVVTGPPLPPPEVRRRERRPPPTLPPPDPSNVIPLSDFPDVGPIPIIIPNFLGPPSELDKAFDEVRERCDALRNQYCIFLELDDEADKMQKSRKERDYIDRNCEILRQALEEQSKYLEPLLFRSLLRPEDYRDLL